MGKTNTDRHISQHQGGDRRVSKDWISIVSVQLRPCTIETPAQEQYVLTLQSPRQGEPDDKD